MDIICVAGFYLFSHLHSDVSMLDHYIVNCCDMINLCY